MNKSAPSKMRLFGVVSALLITQLTGWVSCAESSEEDISKDFKTCPGGYCLDSYLCPNGSINTDGVNIFEQRFNDEDDGPVDIRLEDQNDPCEEFLKRCCASNSAIGTTPRPPVTENESDEIIILPPSTCGTNHPDGYIYRVKDNSVAQFAEFPWMAALLQQRALLDKEAYEYFCGGSLIHKKVVLTAAHCMRDHSELDDIVVRLGEWDTVTENEPLVHQEHAIRKMVVHESFDDQKLHNDLALLILEKEADLNVHINPICLPSPSDNFDDQGCMVSGWGKENFNPKGKYSEVLKKVELPVVPRGKCKQMFKSTKLGPFFRLHTSFMCAGGEPGVDVCKGDGGAPLACKRGNQFIQAGIVAWGLGCGENGIPGAYVKVPNFVDWIKTTLQREGIEL